MAMIFAKISRFFGYNTRKRAIRENAACPQILGIYNYAVS